MPVPRPISDYVNSVQLVGVPETLQPGQSLSVTLAPSLGRERAGLKGTLTPTLSQEEREI